MHVALGRWLQQDPIGFAAGDENLYRYVRNAPTIASDPAGLFALPLTGIAVDGLGWALTAAGVSITFGFWYQYGPRPSIDWGGGDTPPPPFPAIPPGTQPGGLSGGYGGGSYGGGFPGPGGSGTGHGGLGGFGVGGGVAGIGSFGGSGSCGATSGIVIGAPIAGAYMARGMQNIRNDYLERLRRGHPRATRDEICDLLAAAYEAARAAGDTALANTIKLAQKAAGCRRTHYGRR